MLPINYAGLAFMLLGIAFLVVETFNPTVILGLGGVAAFLLGAAMLFKIEAPCAVCLPKFSTGPAAKATSSLMASAGRPTGRKPSHPERWSRWLVSRT
jgi:membrane-bound serine protease (ClpP class)